MYMLVITFILIATIDKKQEEYSKLDIIMKIAITIFLTIAIYYNTTICISAIKKEANPYSMEYICKNIKNDENFSKNLKEMVSRRKYYSHITIFNNILLNQNLDETQYMEIFNILKSEKHLLKNDVYAKIQEIDIYLGIISKIQQNESEVQNSKILEDIKNEINEEIKSIKELLANPERSRLNFEQIEGCEERLKEIEQTISS